MSRQKEQHTGSGPAGGAGVRRVLFLLAILKLTNEAVKLIRHIVTNLR